MYSNCLMCWVFINLYIYIFKYKINIEYIKGNTFLAGVFRLPLGVDTGVAVVLVLFGVDLSGVANLLRDPTKAAAVIFSWSDLFFLITVDSNPKHARHTHL